jgi:fatty acid desaturase
MAYRRYRRYRGYRRSRTSRAKKMAEQLRKWEEQRPILAEIRQTRRPYRVSIAHVFLNGVISCLGSAICVGSFWWLVHFIASRRGCLRNDDALLTLLTRLAFVIAFSVGPAYLASRGGVSFCLLSVAGTVLTIAMIYQAPWSYWAYFGLASVTLFIHLIRAEQEYHDRKADEEELRKRGYDPKDFNL